MTSSMLGYVMAIHKLGENGAEVRSVDIAAELGVARASVCKALDRLSESGLAVRDGSGKVRLTIKGTKAVEEYVPAYERFVRLFRDELHMTKERATAEAVAAAGWPEKEVKTYADSVSTAFQEVVGDENNCRRQVKTTSRKHRVERKFGSRSFVGERRKHNLPRKRRQACTR